MANRSISFAMPSNAENGLISSVHLLSSAPQTVAVVLKRGLKIGKCITRLMMTIRSVIGNQGLIVQRN